MRSIKAIPIMLVLALGAYQTTPEVRDAKAESVALGKFSTQWASAYGSGDFEKLVDGDYAFKVAKWWLEGPQAINEPVRDSGRSLVVFKRGDDGVWRLWRDIDNNTPDVNFDNKPE